MSTISTAGEMKRFGRRVSAIHQAAESAHSNRQRHWSDLFFGASQGDWVRFMNSDLPSLPETIHLRGKAAKSAIEFSKGMKELGLPIGPFFSLARNILGHNPLGVAQALAGFFIHSARIDALEKRTKFNIALAETLRSYD